ncbi:hypothetical protein D3C80_1669570 [compost metagenome]
MRGNATFKTVGIGQVGNHKAAIGCVTLVITAIGADLQILSASVQTVAHRVAMQAVQCGARLVQAGAGRRGTGKAACKLLDIDNTGA